MELVGDRLFLPIAGSRNSPALVHLPSPKKPLIAFKSFLRLPCYVQAARVALVLVALYQAATRHVEVVLRVIALGMQWIDQGYYGSPIEMLKPDHQP